MAIDRQHNKVIFICDECGDDFNTDTGDFLEALAHMKDEGWLVRRDADDQEWEHICNECVNGQ